MLVVERKRKQPRRDRTLFRNTLNKLMVSRDIFFWKDLRSELERAGYDVGQSRLSQYLNGQRDPEDLEELFAAIGRALDLTREEKMLLAFSYAYPHGNGRSEQVEPADPAAPPDEPGLTEENESKLDAARRDKTRRDEERLRERARDTGDRAP